MSELTYLSAEVVSRVFTMAEAFAAVDEAARAWVAGRTEVPARTALHADAARLETLVMPGVIDSAYAGAKLWFATDGSTVLPGTGAVIVLLDPEHGLVIMDGSAITDLRTGAMTGLAARVLAPEARTLAVVGAGIQARTQVLALVHALPQLAQVRISSRRPEARAAFVAALTEELAGSGHAPAIVSCDDPRTACEGAEVVVAATTSATPVLDDDWLQAAVLVCGVGSHAPHEAELDARTVARAGIVVVDTRRGGIDGAGDIARVIDAGQLERDAVVELGELLNGLPEAPSGLGVLKTVGFAAADLVAARLVASRASAAQLGIRIDA